MNTKRTLLYVSYRYQYRFLKTYISDSYQSCACKLKLKNDLSVHLLMKGETPRKTRGSLIGMVNEREFGVSFLEANITDSEDEGSSTLQARLDNIPPSVGE